MMQEMKDNENFMKRIRKYICPSFIKNNFSRIFTIAEKNVKLYLRFKFQFIYSFITPFLGILLSLVILSRFFGANIRFGEDAGAWDETSLPIFILIAYNIELLRRIINEVPKEFRQEKYWKTLPALMIAPFNRLHLFFGIMFSHLIIISIPFIIFFILGYLMVPISFLTIIFVLFLYLLIDIIFSGIGLFLGVFAISNENYWRFFTIGISLIWYISCVSYPFEMFPSGIQSIILLNPFYYLFDFLRITWIKDDFFLTIALYPIHFLIFISTAIIIPIISIYSFNKIYEKFGIIGY